MLSTAISEETRSTINAIIKPELGHTKLNNLTTEQIRKWLNGIAAAPARVRTKLGAPQRFRADCGDPKTLMLPGFDTFPSMRFLAS